MSPKFDIGDRVKVPENTEGAIPWWIEKEATVRAVIDEGALYEVLFIDGQDFAFVEEHMLAPVNAAKDK